MFIALGVRGLFLCSHRLAASFLLGFFSALLWAVTVGISLFAFCQRGEAHQLLLTAAGVGGAVLGVVETALPVLGPGPTIGALIGVAGAVGVCISAAGAWTVRYAPAVSRCKFFGKAGVTTGAAVGAFLSCCAHGGLSKVFVALCTSMIPTALFFKLLVLEIPWQRFNTHLFVCFLTLIALMPFTSTTMLTLAIEWLLKLVPKVYSICLICVISVFLVIHRLHSHYNG